MNVLDLNLPDLSGHPPPPKLSFEEYEHWICEIAKQRLVPDAPKTWEEFRAEFMKNEGSQKDPWPDFGAASGL